MSNTIPAELCQGPYDGRVGEVTFDDEPPPTLQFSLADKDDSKLFVASYNFDDKLTAVYRLIDEKPRKVLQVDDNGQARSAKGVRYRYDSSSPCQTLIDEADRRALLTADAAEQVNRTRQLLLAERGHKR